MYGEKATYGYWLDNDGAHRLHVESDSDPINWREDGEPADHMVCWHSRYNLGDKHNFDEPREFMMSLASDVDGDLIIKMIRTGKLPSVSIKYVRQNGGYYALFSNSGKYGANEEDLTYNNVSDFSGDQCLEYMSDEDLGKLVELSGAVVLPLYLYDHSGITMSTGSFNDPWDSGQVGYIYVTKKEIETLGWPADKVEEYLKGSVEDYDNYLTGNVWGYVVEDYDEKEGCWDDGDSCWGFYGDYYDDPAKMIHEVIGKDIKVYPDAEDVGATEEDVEHPDRWDSKADGQLEFEEDSSLDPFGQRQE
jgi:hypothetical protein